MTEERVFLTPRRRVKALPAQPIGDLVISPARPRPEFVPEPGPPPRALSTYKLLPELVPQPLWNVALRTEMGKTRWLNEVSRPIRAYRRNKCEVCNGTGYGSPSGWRTCCHEVWDYSDATPAVQDILGSRIGTEMLLIDGWDKLVGGIDEASRVVNAGSGRRRARRLAPAPVARLVDFRCLCWRCNQVVHIGFTEKYARKGELLQAVEHGAEVNGMTLEQMAAAILVFRSVWRVRSALDWTASWDGWEAILDRKLGRSPPPPPPPPPPRRSGWRGGVSPSAFDLDNLKP